MEPAYFELFQRAVLFSQGSFYGDDCKTYSFQHELFLSKALIEARLVILYSFIIYLIGVRGEYSIWNAGKHLFNRCER